MIREEGRHRSTSGCASGMGSAAFTVGRSGVCERGSVGDTRVFGLS